MTNFDKMEQNFVALTEEELMNVDGGIAWEVVSVGIAIAWGIYQVGEAAGKTFYYITHPQFLINMSKKTFWIILLVITIVVTAVGLGLSAYNYYVFDRPFFNSTTKGLLSAFVMSVLMIIIGVLKEN